MNAKEYIEYLGLIRHPEGGYYRETYRSKGLIPATAVRPPFNGDRNFSTAIFFLLEENDFSAFHRIKSDECWHFYAGGPLLIHVIEENGNCYPVQLGNKINENQLLQFVVPANRWFASEPAAGTAFSLVGCTVSPGFDFDDFEMASVSALSETFPQHAAIIKRLSR